MKALCSFFFQAEDGIRDADVTGVQTCALPITPLQIASAYTAFAANGTRTTPVAIDRITTGKGTTIAQPTAQKNEVLRPEIAYVMSSFMKDVVNRGTGAPIRARGFKFNVAGKTGTSRDGWLAGFTPNLVCVVWVGIDDGSQLGLTCDA